MKAADLYLLMEDPSLLTKETLSPLRQIVDEYPYFHIARMLYLKNLAVLNDIRFAAELKRMAVYIPDRRKLFALIKEKESAADAPSSPVAALNVIP